MPQTAVTKCDIKSLQARWRFLANDLRCSRSLSKTLAQSISFSWRNRGRIGVFLKMSDGLNAHVNARTSRMRATGRRDALNGPEVDPLHLDFSSVGASDLLPVEAFLTRGRSREHTGRLTSSRRPRYVHDSAKKRMCSQPKFSRTDGFKMDHPLRSPVFS